MLVEVMLLNTKKFNDKKYLGMGYSSAVAHMCVFYQEHAFILRGLNRSSRYLLRKADKRARELLAERNLL